MVEHRRWLSRAVSHNVDITRALHATDAHNRDTAVPGLSQVFCNCTDGLWVSISPCDAARHAMSIFPIRSNDLQLAQPLNHTNRSEIGTILISCFFFLPSLNHISQKCSVCSEHLFVTGWTPSTLQDQESFKSDWQVIRNYSCV